MNRLFLILPYLFFMSSCYGPKIKVCTFIPEEGGIHCFDQRTEKDSDISFSDPEIKKYVATPASDYERVVKFMKNGCK